MKPSQTDMMTMAINNLRRKATAFAEAYDLEALDRTKAELLGAAISYHAQHCAFLIEVGERHPLGLPGRPQTPKTDT